MSVPSAYDLHHHSHDSAQILKRWHAVARQARLTLETLYLTPDGFPVLLARTRRQAPGGLYLSTGVHGDEPAPVAALLEWAEENIACLREANAWLLPLFNPDGLVRNTRVDRAGTDLNRMFHDATHPHLAPWHQAMRGAQFQLGIMLHEDYDAQGMYSYEVSRDRAITTQAYLDAAARFIPKDQRRKIDGFPSCNGVILRRRIPRHLPGLPEALVLYQQHTPSAFTFESPSEFSLQQRVAAHRAIIAHAFAAQSSHQSVLAKTKIAVGKS